MGTVYRSLHPEQAQFLAASWPQLVKFNGTNFPIMGLGYDATNDGSAFWLLDMINYGSGNLTLDVLWYADTASSGVVRWGGAIAAITPETDTQDVETKAFATETTLDDTHLGTTGQRVHRATITITNLDSVANRDLVSVRLRRVASNVADTMSGDAIVILAVLSYSDT